MDPMILILIVGGGLAAAMLVVGIIISATSERPLVEERLGRYVDEAEAEAIKKGERTSPVGDWLNVRLERSTWGGGIARDLARADLKLKPGEYLSAMIIAGMGVGVIAW